ncbi:glycosyltransferase [Anaerotruncus colihominis]|uniref:glycosyltransferase n=1 Tax=Anaerotruncus colihominis TaxID=169435 RepID=UPI001FF2AF86|nr:glycosyltransferase [Anaerotruncus colihominis]UOX66982.1 glycosyltransferase [Anaerotruncus colihominis]
MSEIYNQEYYHTDCGPIPYEEPEQWEIFFGAIADRIVQDLRPRTVLDAGCAMGYLVAALRERGVEAYGIDISDYAICCVREDIRPYCAVGSLLDPLPEGLPEQYDVVVTIEVLEHLYADAGKKAIQNLCSLADTVIFSSSPDDFTEKTHLNVQQREYWARLFAENGFYDDLNYRPTYITYHAACYRKKSDVLRQIEDYERNIRLMDGLHRDMLEQAAKRPFQANLYWAGNEEGFSEAQTLHYIGDERDGQVRMEVRLPKVSALRFDPAEKSCIVEDLHVYSDIGTLRAVPENGIEWLGYTIFLEQDPRFRIELEGKAVSSLTIRAHVLPLQYPENTEMLAQLFADWEDAKREQNRLNEELSRREGAYRSAVARQEAVQQAQLKQQEEQHQTQLETSRRRIVQLEKDKQAMQEELAHYKTHYHAAIVQREELKRKLSDSEQAYSEISNAFFWKITWIFRVIVDMVKRPFIKTRYGRLFGKGMRSLKKNGLRNTWRKVQDWRKHRQNFARLAKKPLFTKEELEAQRHVQFARDIKFSIVVPLYNTPARFLHEMIRSVLDQTYGNWELCMADGSDAQHENVGQICKQYVRKDSRIHYVKLEKNLGISGNTNACLEMSTGDYIGLFDHDDLLHPAALFEVMRAICEQDADFIYTDENTFHDKPEDAFCPHFKPDFAPDTLRANNYICHFTVFKRQLMDQAGRFNSKYDGSQDFDMVLRLTEKAEKIFHISEILYFWRAHKDSVAQGIEAKPYVIEAAKGAITEHLSRVGLEGFVEDTVVPSMYRIKYTIKAIPKISIIIANCDHADDLRKCITSIQKLTTYKNWEIIIVENNSIEIATRDYYQELKQLENIKIVTWEAKNGEFNYSAINNYGAKFATGEYILLLNNDTEVISADWIQEMLMFAQRTDVGAVGAKLYYFDDTIQHAGIGIGILTLAGHYHRGFDRCDFGYMGRLIYAHNVSAVTAACMMIRRNVWKEVGGLDETFQVAFNDVDLCMRIRQAGYLIVWTPYAELYHYESKSRGYDDTPEKQKRFEGEVRRFQTRWAKELAAGDPYYNPNLTLDREDFSLR